MCVCVWKRVEAWMEKKKIHANERTRLTIVLLSRKLGEEDVRGQNDDPCVDHLREWMQKKNKKNKRKDIFQKRKRIKEEEEEKKRGKRNVWAVVCHLPFREDVIMGSPENDRSTVFAWTSNVWKWEKDK